MNRESRMDPAMMAAARPMVWLEERSDGLRMASWEGPGPQRRIVHHEAQGVQGRGPLRQGERLG